MTQRQTITFYCTPYDMAIVLSLISLFITAVYTYIYIHILAVC